MSKKGRKKKQKHVYVDKHAGLAAGAQRERLALEKRWEQKEVPSDPLPPLAKVPTRKVTRGRK